MFQLFLPVLFYFSPQLQVPEPVFLGPLPPDTCIEYILPRKRTSWA